MEALALDGRLDAARGFARAFAGGVGRVWAIIGSVFGLFIASYTGVLLSVSNQPLWSDTWVLGALFLASGLSGSAALLIWLSTYRRDVVAETDERLRFADGYFAVLEVIAIVLFFISMASAGQLGRALTTPWLILWVLVIASLVPPLMGLSARRAQMASSAGSVVVSTTARATLTSAIVVLFGVLLMRAVVIFSAQF